MLAFIEKEITLKNKFITYDELLDIFSISECTPGPISINCATFIGYKVGGLLGSIISTLAISLPSFIIILIISIFLNSLKEFQIILRFLNGIKIGVLPLLITSVYKINSKTKKNKYHYPIIIFVLLLSLFFNLSSVLIILGTIIIYSFVSLTKIKGVK